MPFQAEQSAEFLSPFGQALLTDAHQHCPVVGYHGHAHLHHSALQTFVTYMRRTARHQRRDVTFHHGTTVATGAGEVYLMGGPKTV